MVDPTVQDDAVIKLVFSSKRNIGSYLIRLFTWSSWSHVSYLDDLGFVYESVGIHGVRRVPFVDVIPAYNKYVIVEYKKCSDIQKNQFVNYLASQVGKGYDYLAVLAIALKKKWHDKSRWECSELINSAFERAGLPLFRSEEAIKITPQQLWQRYPDGPTYYVRVD